MPGAKPYNPALCASYYHPPPPPPHPTPLQLERYHKFLQGNIFNSAHCPAVVSQSSLWMFGALWAVVILVVGFIFFWRAEVQYGRG
jgi:hypothetical protein